LENKMKNLLAAVSLLSLALLGGCTGGDDKDSGTTDTAAQAE
jgi:hypothetical protein